jgi:dihydrodipicolinate synthase/N-acetylneuraminate lyase
MCEKKSDRDGDGYLGNWEFSASTFKSGGRGRLNALSGTLPNLAEQFLEQSTDRVGPSIRKMVVVRV